MPRSPAGGTTGRGSGSSKARSPCPVAGALDLLGDRWTLLILRDLLLGKSRYGQFLASPEGISTNLLADRLQRLEAAGLVTAVPYTLDLYSIANREIAAREFEPVPLLLVAAAWYLAVTSVLMVGQFYLERYYSRGASRKLTTKQLEALAKAQTAQLGEPHV